MNNAQLRAIMKEDNARRASRRLLEDATLGLSMIEAACDSLSDASKIAANTVRGARVNPCLVRGIGTVNPPVKPRASRNSWEKLEQHRAVGVATGTETTHKIGDPATVLVIKDGIETVVPVSHFRGSRVHASHKVKGTTVVPETARHNPKLQHDFNA